MTTEQRAEELEPKENEMPQQNTAAASTPAQTAPAAAASTPAPTAADELETYKSAVSKAEQAARIRAIESRIPGFVPDGARKLIARGVLAELGAFAVDLGTLDAKTPQQIVDAIAAAGLDSLRAPAPTAPAAAAPTPAPTAPAAAASTPAPTAAPNAIVPPAPTQGQAPRPASGRIAGTLYEQPAANPVAEAIAAMLKTGA